MKFKNKNILIIIGSIFAVTSIVTPLAIVFSKKDNGASNSILKPKISEPKVNEKSNKKPLVKKPLVKKPSLHYANDELRTNLYNFVPLLQEVKPLKKLIANKKGKDAFTQLVAQLLKSGIKNIKFSDVKIIIDNFNLSEKLKNIVKAIAFTQKNETNWELLNLIFNKGIARINNDKYKNQKINVMNFVKSLVPSSVIDLVSLEELEKMVFTGFSEKAFEKLITEIINKKIASGVGGFATSLLSSEIKKIYSYVPIIKNGIMNASAQDWKHTFLHLKNIANFKVNIPIIGSISFSKFIKDKDGIQSDWQLLNIVKNIANQINKLSIPDKITNKSELDEVSNALANFFNKGLNWITEKQSLHISNIIEWALNFKQKSIYKVDLQSFKFGIKGFFKNLKSKNNENLDLSKIDNAKSLTEVVSVAKSIDAYRNNNGVKVTKALSISSKSIYESLKNDRILEKDITDDIGWFFDDDIGLKTTIQKILHKYYDKDGKQFSEKHQNIENIFNSFKKDNAKDENNVFLWWDKIIDSALSIKTYNKDGKVVKINWFDEFKKLGKHNDKYEPYKDYNSSSKSIINKFLKTKYYISNDPNVNDRITGKIFANEIKTFKIKPILNKINDLFKKGLYINKIFEYKVNLNSKIDKYLNDNINKYNFHQRKQETIDQYRKDVKKQIGLYKTKNQTSDQLANKAIDLQKLDNKKLEGVKQIYSEAKNILQSISNGIWNSKGEKQDISKPEIIKKIIPEIPLKDYAYDLTKEVLNKTINDNNGIESTMTRLVLNNIKPLGSFLLNGYPKTPQDEKDFISMLKNILEFLILKIDFLKKTKMTPDQLLTSAKLLGFDSIINSVKKYRLNETKKTIS